VSKPLLIVILGLIVPALSYMLVAYGYLGLNRPWMSFAYIGYVMGNIGILMDTLPK
jgi:hypothetical protein